MKSPIRVSLVEDDEEVRENIAGYLSSAPGFECVGTHASAEDAVINLPAETPDVVLMDINLEEMNGIDCIQHLKPLLPKGQIVMLTAFEDADVIFKALSAGASGYLLKRMPPEKLLEAIHEVQRGGAPMSASIARKVVLSFQKTQPAPGDENDLSMREREVLQGLAAGHAYKKIADQLGVSIHTVRNYIRRIYEKLHVHSRSQALAKFHRQ